MMPASQRQGILIPGYTSHQPPHVHQLTLFTHLRSHPLTLWWLQVQAEVEDLLKGDLRQLLFGGQGQVVMSGHQAAAARQLNGRGTPGTSPALHLLAMMAHLYWIVARSCTFPHQVQSQLGHATALVPVVSHAGGNGSGALLLDAVPADMRQVGAYLAVEVVSVPVTSHALHISSDSTGHMLAFNQDKM
jgi:hypothetical protein